MNDVRDGGSYAIGTVRGRGLRLLAVGVAIVAAIMVFASAAWAATESEPNDSVDAATSLLTDGQNAASMSGSLTADSDTVDYYAIPVARGQEWTLTITADASNASSVFQLDRYAANEPWMSIESVKSNGAAPTMTWPSWDEGMVYVAVTSAGGFGSYSLAYEVTQPATISGSVTADDTAAMLAGISVTAYSVTTDDAGAPAYNEVGYELTDETGNYSMTGLFAGDYVLKFSDSEGRYATEYWNNQPLLAKASQFVVDAAATVTKDATLAAAGAVSGKVLNSRGVALPSIDIYVLAVDANGDPIELAAQGRTDTNGAYNVSGLAAGRYIVAYNDGDNEYVSDIYSDELGEPVTISVSAGDTASLDDVMLVTGVRIEGRVQTGNLKGVSGLLVEAYSVTDLENRVAFDVTSQNGDYGIGALPEGKYVIKFAGEEHGIDVDGIEVPYRNEWYNNVDNPTAAKVITVARGSVVTGVNAIIENGYEPSATASITPGAFATSATSGWRKTSPEVSLSTAYNPPVEDGTTPPISLTKIHFSFNGGLDWKVVGADNIGGPFSAEGSHKLQYFASNQFGAEELKTAGYLNLDSKPPTTKAYSTSIAYGHYGYIKYRISDALPGSARAVARLYIKKGSVNKKIISLGTKAENATLSYKYRATMPRGKYTLLVSAADLAGNSAKTRTVGYLTIK